MNDAMSHIRAWCQRDGVWTVNDSGGGLALSRSGISLAVLERGGDERVEVEHAVQLSAADLRAAAGAAHPDPVAVGILAVDRLVETWPGLIRGRTARAGDGLDVHLTAPLYLDGFTRQSFLSLAEDLFKIRRALDRVFQDMREQHGAMLRFSETLQRSRASADAMMRDVEKGSGGPVVSGAPVSGPPQERRCTNASCGQPVPAGKSFCTKCGTPAPK